MKWIYTWDLLSSFRRTMLKQEKNSFTIFQKRKRERKKKHLIFFKIVHVTSQSIPFEPLFNKLENIILNHIAKNVTNATYIDWSASKKKKKNGNNLEGRIIFVN